MSSQYHHSVKKKPTLFFKPIHSSSLPDKLMIPRKFVKKYEDALSDTLFLKLPHGAEWEVNLEKRNGDVWLEKGWREFAEYHSLFKGRLLVFGYDDSASHCLNVLIMDLMTSEEIDYPSNPGKEGKETCNGEVLLQLPKTETLENEGSPSAGPRKKNPPLSGLPKQYKRKRISKGGHNVDATFDSQDADLHATSRKSEGVSQQSMFSSKLLKREVDKGNKALERARAFKSEYPSFLFVTKPSHINGSGKVFIPRNFARMFLGSKRNGESTILRVLNGSVWVAKLIITKHNKTQARFEISRGGWNALVKDNELNVDDVCVFELIKGTTHEISFRVSIFRNTDASNTPLSHATGKIVVASDQGQKKKRLKIKTETKGFQKADLHATSSKSQGVREQGLFDSRCLKPETGTGTENRALERAQAFKSQYPSFLFVAKPSYINASCNMAMPSNFTRRFLGSKKTGETINLWMLNGRVWVAKFIRRKHVSGTKFEISRVGWDAFVKDNGLKVDDVCVFELIKGTTHEIKFRVSIFQNTGPSKTGQNRNAIQGQKKKRVKVETETKEYRLPPTKPKSTGKYTIASDQGQKKKRVKIKTKCETEFQVSLKKPKFTKATSSRDAAAADHSFNSENPFFKLTIRISHGPGVPGAFVKKYFEQGKHVVELQVGGKSWRVKLIRTSGSVEHCFFSEGWAAFVRENHLQLGDVCFFELVNRDHNLMEVSIFKHSST